MTASDYTHVVLHQQRERAMMLHNERRRVTLERLAGAEGRDPRTHLIRSLRARLNTLVTRVPVRG
ncbi:hypothetical protein GCM10022234_02160 [Aeromicrobium panaciterrae]|uniref:hypothetical protein n=1 Tax=Aeromicrobium panaciterrae TaxID=363861 RepID=UPI0031CDC382